MLKKLLIISILSFSAVSQAKVSIYKLLEKGASFQEIQTAIEQGAKLNSKTFIDRNTPLILAVKKNRSEVVKLLLEAGADLNLANRFTKTPLMYASLLGHAEMVKLLVSYGADVNGQDPYGETPLMYAAEENHPEVVRLLLAYGADANAKTINGDTALTKGLGSLEIVKLLLQD